MGTFGGHALPGSFFIYFAVWAIYFMLRNFYRRRAYELRVNPQRVPKYHNWISFPAPLKHECCKSKEIPIDSWLKLIACVIGIAGEVITGFDLHWTKFIHFGNAQHCTMYSMFALGGIFELVVFYRISRMPRRFEYLFGMLAFLSEGFLFFFHLHGRTPLDIHIHLLLAGLVWGGLAIGVLEVAFPYQPLFGLLRVWTFLGQGTWFWHVGAILYPPVSWIPVWDENDPVSLTKATNLFTYHLLINFIFIVVMASVMSVCYLGRMDAATAAGRLAVDAKTGDTTSLQDETEMHGRGVEFVQEHEVWNRRKHQEALQAHLDVAPAELQP